MDGDAEFFQELEALIAKHNHKGFFHIVGLLDYAKQALILNTTTNAFNEYRPEEVKNGDTV